MGVAKKPATTFYHYYGRSMWPVFQEGDLLEVKSLTLKELRAGDCITYRLTDCGTLVSHRINAILGNTLFTRGDAHLQPDKLSVDPDQLVGLIIGRFRLGDFKQVHGGIKGRLTGKFYHYAGRIDPQRDAHGGQAARFLRNRLRWLTGRLYRRGRVKEFIGVDKQSRRHWIIGQRSWARFDDKHNNWLTPWPQSLLIDPARLPVHKRQ